MYYYLRHSELPRAIPYGEEEPILDHVRDNLGAAMKQEGKKLDLVYERRLTLSGTPGREMEYAADAGFTVRTRLFLKGRLLYQMSATTPDGRKDEQEPRRFLESFQFEDPTKPDR